MIAAAPYPSGRLEAHRHRSGVLADNPWGDPVERTVQVYLPAGYREDGPPLPVLWYLAAYTNSGAAVGNWRNFGETLPQRLDRLIGSGAMGPVVVVAPDCFTRLGGNQYVNSPSVGRYEDYVHDELLSWAEQRFNLLPGPRHRGVFGKSSGAYGALRFGLSRPDDWAALASHAGDAQFEVIFRPEFPQAAATLSRHGGSIEAFLEAFWTADSVSGNEVHTLMLICQAASYDPNADRPREIRLPFDLETLELDPVRWRNWLANDPVEMLPKAVEGLKSLACVYIDCGNRDQYHIQFGTRLLHRQMNFAGVDHHYQEFDGTHSGIDYRFDQSLPLLYRAVSQENDSP